MTTTADSTPLPRCMSIGKLLPALATTAREPGPGRAPQRCCRSTPAEVGPVPTAVSNAPRAGPKERNIGWETRAAEGSRRPARRFGRGARAPPGTAYPMYGVGAGSKQGAFSTASSRVSRGIASSGAAHAGCTPPTSPRSHRTAQGRARGTSAAPLRTAVPNRAFG